MFCGKHVTRAWKYSFASPKMCAWIWSLAAPQAVTNIPAGLISSSAPEASTIRATFTEKGKIKTDRFVQEVFSLLTSKSQFQLLQESRKRKVVLMWYWQSWYHKKWRQTKDKGRDGFQASLISSCIQEQYLQTGMVLVQPKL